MNNNLIINNIKDKSIIVINENYIFSLLIDDTTFSYIKSIFFDFSSMYFKIILNTEEELELLLPLRLIKYRKEFVNFIYSNFSNFLNDKEYFSNNCFEKEIIKEINFKNFIIENYNENFIFGNFKNQRITNYKELESFLNFV